MLKHEDLLHFLINDIIKHGFFQNTNYDTFINICKNLQLPSGLISNLENEYLMDIAVKESEIRKREYEEKIIKEKTRDIKI